MNNEAKKIQYTHTQQLEPKLETIEKTKYII